MVRHIYGNGRANDANVHNTASFRLSFNDINGLYLMYQIFHTSYAPIALSHISLRPTPSAHEILAIMTVRPTPPVFPPHTHAKLSPKTYLTAHLNSSPPTRPSGRSIGQSRPVTAHTGSLNHCHGSAVIRQGDTAIVCGVRGEILKVEDIPEHALSNENLSDEGGPSSLSEERGTGPHKLARRRRQEQDQLARLGVLVPNIELATGCSPEYLPGGPPTPVAQALSQRLLTTLHTTAIIDPESLRIHPSSSVSDAASQPSRPSSSSSSDSSGGVPLPPETTASSTQEAPREIKAYWTLYIDILFISLDHGPHSAFSAALTAMLCAVRNTKLPYAYYSPDDECILCDPDKTTYSPLGLRPELPVAASFGVFTSSDREENDGGHGGKRRNKSYILSDPDAFEEDLCDEVLTIILVEKGTISRMEKSGGGYIDVDQVRECVRLAQDRRDEVLKALEEAGDESETTAEKKRSSTAHNRRRRAKHGKQKSLASSEGNL